MDIKAVLFDLDGTLADTALDLGGALNTLLRKHRLPEKSMDAVRPVASHGSSGLLYLGMGITPQSPDFAAMREAFLNEYENCFDRDTVLFPEINPLISRLQQRGIIWGIITNKPKTFTDRLVPKLGFTAAPAICVSGDTCSEPKPSVLPMFYACRHIGVAPENCLYVGDAERDMQAGGNAGMTTVLAEWGYIAADDDVSQWQADFKVQTPLQILDLI